MGLLLAYEFNSYSFIIPTFPLNVFCSYLLFGKKKELGGLLIYVVAFLLALFSIFPNLSFDNDTIRLIAMWLATLLSVYLGVILGIVLRVKPLNLSETKMGKKVRNLAKNLKSKREKNKEKNPEQNENNLEIE